MRPRSAHSWITFFVISCFIAGTYSGQCRLRFSPNTMGYCMNISACTGAVLKSLCPAAGDGIGCCVIGDLRYDENIRTNITKKMFTTIFHENDRSLIHYEQFVYSLNTTGAVSCHQQSAFLTQIAHDTNFLTTSEEFRSNIDILSKEEIKYLGRGAIHVGGKPYYQWLNRKLKKINTVEQPELLALPSKAFSSAALIWTHSYSNSHGGPLKHVSYNSLADGSKYGFLLLSYFLRGHLEDAEKLLRIWKRVNQVLKCPCVKSNGPRCKVNGREGWCKYVNDCKGKQVGSFQHCKGPANTVRCSLDFAAPVDVTVQIKETNVSNSKLLGIIKRIQNRIASNPDPQITVTASNNATGSPNNEVLQRDIRKYAFPPVAKMTHHRASKRDKQEIRQMVRSHRLFKRKLDIIITSDTSKNPGNSTVPDKPDNQTNVILFLSYKENPFSVIGRDDLLNYEFNIDEPFIEERLIEKILTGPWHLLANQTTTLQLERNETVYLAIPCKNQTDLVPFISITNSIGSVEITGVLSIEQLPASQDYYCSASNTKRPVRTQESRHMVHVINPDNDFTTKVKKINSLLINSKAIIIARGLEEANIIHMKVSQKRPYEFVDQERIPLLVLVSCVCTIICCSLGIACLCAIINAAKCYQVTQKTVCKAVSSCEEDEKPNTVIQPSGLLVMHEESINCNQSQEAQLQRPFCISYFQISVQAIKENESNVVDGRSLRILTYSQLFRALCIIVFNITFIIGTTIDISKVSCSVNMYFTSFISNSLYSWILLETLLGLDQKSRFFNRSGYSSSTLATFVSVTIGLPAVLASIPNFLHDVTENKCCWLTLGHNGAWLEISFKIILFMLSIISSSILLAKEIRRSETSIKQSWRIAAAFTISMQFSASWVLSVVLISWTEFYTLRYLFAATNFFMGIIVLMSIYYQTKENVENLQRKASIEEGNIEDEHDDEKIISPAISRNMLSDDETF